MDVLIIYHSQEYGNTEKMASAIADGVKSAGGVPELSNANKGRIDMDRFRKANAVAIGSPDYYSYVAGGLKMFFDDWYIEKKKSPENMTGKTYGVFFSHGGGGAVKSPLESLCAHVGEKTGSTVESRGAPSEEVLTQCRELGRLLAEA